MKFRPSPPVHAVVLMLMASFLLAGCDYLKNVQLLRSGSVDRTAFVDSVRFDWRKDLIVVDAKLQDSDEIHEFIFDTAAFDNKVEYDLADRLGLEVVSSKTSSSAQGVSRQIQTIRINALSLGATRFLETGAGKLRYDRTSASQCIASDGLIGANLTRLVNWRIDYPARMLHFSDMPFDMDDRYDVVEFDTPTLSGTPGIEMHINGKRIGPVLFDTGYNGGLVLPMRLAASFESHTEFVVLDRSTSGIHGVNVDSLVVKELMVEVAGHEATIPVSFSALDKALLGNDFLEHFVSIIDYNSDLIQLIPKDEVDVDWPRRFLPGILDDSTWVVDRTTPDLPLALGDTLKTVNGHRPADLFTDFCDYILHTDRLFEGPAVDVQTQGNALLRIDWRHR